MCVIGCRAAHTSTWLWDPTARTEEGRELSWDSSLRRIYLFQISPSLLLLAAGTDSPVISARLICAARVFVTESACVEDSNFRASSASGKGHRLGVVPRDGWRPQAECHAGCGPLSGRADARWRDQQRMIHRWHHGDVGNRQRV
ncbi:hypothetical protein BaRGS_00013183 [Batillaria attramentaria]|uniref:Uncharacterized protein n=1 Tax=Batillaria attramentaria TaxID=370345 RepID=A0ABD0L825_9CAEN